MIRITRRCARSADLAIKRCRGRPMSATSGDKSSTPGKRRLPLTIYRSLLRWCDATSPAIPLTQVVPPIHLRSMQINADGLRVLERAIVDERGADEHATDWASRCVSRGLLDPSSQVSIHDDHLDWNIRNADDARKLFQVVFRVNAGERNPEAVREQLSNGFDVLKSLNGLTMDLSKIEQRRERNMDRDNVAFKVGQIVKHRTEGWRAVVVGWKKSGEEEAESNGDDGRDQETGAAINEDQSPTSLTNKSYTVDTDGGGNVKYALLLDTGDAYLRSSQYHSGNPSTSTASLQNELALVGDERLGRIRNLLATEYFNRYDNSSGCFAGNERIQYEYPMDTPAPTIDDGNASQATQLENCQIIVDRIRSEAQQWSRVILDETSAPNERNLPIVATILDRINELAGNFDQNESASSSVTLTTQFAFSSIKQLHNVIVEVGDLMWQRRRSVDNATAFRFEVGDVVKHTQYGFRGVIIARDRRPTIDVTGWDGLRHLDHPEDHPFYQIVPDQNDCIKAFGGSRDIRYVSDMNLEDRIPPSSDEASLDLDLPHGWTSASGVYKPPADTKFKYAVGGESEETTERILSQILERIEKLLVSCQNSALPSPSPTDEVASSDASNPAFSDSLSWLLKNADEMKHAADVSDLMKEIWKANADADLRYKLELGMEHLLANRIQHASTLFEEIVQIDPAYSEAWNKLSMCDFMRGNLVASMVCAKKSIALLPGHYQAINGLGLAHMESNHLSHAKAQFEHSLALDPWSPVSSRLSLVIDKLQAQNPKDDTDE